MTRETAATARSYTTWQATALVTLRLLIGWHFLYEGLGKLVNPYWSSASYLGEARWLFQNQFLNIASSEAALRVVDFLNVWGLTLIGLALLLGLFARAAAIGAVVLLALYYIVAPPFVGFTYAVPMEGSYLVVNKVLIELAAVLVLLAFPTSGIFGLDRFLPWTRPGAVGGLRRAQA